MALSIIGSVTGNAASGVAVTPTGAASGDWLFFFVCAYGTNATTKAGLTSFTPPAGATLAAGPFGYTQTNNGAGPTQVWVYQKLLSGTPAASYTFTLVADGGFGGTDVATICVRGASATPVDSGPGAPTNTNSAPGGSVNASAPGLTTSNANELLLWFYFGQNQSLSAAPSGMSAHVITTGGPTGSAWELCSQQLTTAGATGTKTATTTSDEWIGLMFAVVPAVTALSSDGPYSDPAPPRAPAPRRPAADAWALAPLAAVALGSFFDQSTPARSTRAPIRAPQEQLLPALSFGRTAEWGNDPPHRATASRAPINDFVLGPVTPPPPGEWVDWAPALTRGRSTSARAPTQDASLPALAFGRGVDWGNDPARRAIAPRQPGNESQPWDAPIPITSPTAWVPWDSPAPRPTATLRAVDNPPALPALTFGGPFLGQDEAPARAPRPARRPESDFLPGRLTIPLASFLAPDMPARSWAAGARQPAIDFVLSPLAPPPAPSTWTDWDGPTPRPWGKPRWSPDNPPFFFDATVAPQVGPLQLSPQDAPLLSTDASEGNLLLVSPAESTLLQLFPKETIR